MTDKEKMQSILDSYCDKQPSFSDIVATYLNRYQPSLYEFMQFENKIHTMYYNKILKLEHSIDVAKEYAAYVSLYLKGEMYTDEEDAKKCLPLQIEHAEKVVKLLGE